ncbi:MULTISPECIES: diguanylate cyclase [unclassified Rhizobium]|uniref:GGDEF domain-containing protein n=1 Tax=unclassified Rhizobium TaxID=2613769 RepID=UPI0037F9D2AE
MGSIDSFAFITPAMMATFGIVFLILSRYQLPSAFAWGLGFLFGALGLLVSIAPLPETASALIGDVFYFISFYYYGEALLIAFRMPLYMRERLTFAVLCLLGDLYIVIGLGSLHAELLLVDISISLLLGVPLIMVAPRARRWMEWAMIIITGLVVIDTVAVVLIFNLVEQSSDQLSSFQESDYSRFSQLSTGLLSLTFALAAFGSMMVEILARYRDVAARDPLTGLLNRRGFDEVAAASLAGEGRKGAVIVTDIDLFKQVNDQVGHEAGDQVICALADQLRVDMPRGAVAARFGGEEFVVFVPRITLAEGGVLAQAIRMRFAAHDWRSIGIERQITASFGVAMVEFGEQELRAPIARADKALYAAKAAGRNKVMTEGASPGREDTTATVIELAEVGRKRRTL